MASFWFYLLLFLWALGEAAKDVDNKVETDKKTNVPKMAPNSKFLNPYLDDDTNLQTAIGAFEEEPKTPNENKSEASDILLRLSENFVPPVNLRAPKSLHDWKIVSLLNSLIIGNKDFKFKKT